MDLKLQKTELVSVEEVRFIQELDQCRFPNRVYQRYIHTTNDNIELSYEDAKKKLIRNIVLGSEAKMIKGMEHKRVFFYGNLAIHINLEEKSICYIDNCENKTFHWHGSKQKRNVLNAMIGC